jgi:putative hydrolase of HD superfamily
MQPIINFILELEKLKGVTRKVKPLGLERYENSAEHSWSLALLAISLQHFAESPVDINHVIRMLLVHDIGEIDAGDTFFFDAAARDQRKAAELASVQRIFGILPDGHGARLLALWQEFDVAETAEARFANAVDRAMPVLMNLNNNGQSWRENGISYATVLKKVGPPIRSGCPALWSYIEARLMEASANGLFGS